LTKQREYFALGLLPPGPHPFRQFDIKIIPSDDHMPASTRFGVISFQYIKRELSIWKFIQQLLTSA
jgi:hypothetical protein